jgi:hypothetical protein
MFLPLRPLNRRPRGGNKTGQVIFILGDLTRRSTLMLAMVVAALWLAPVSAQSRSQLGLLCTSEETPADKQIDACNKIIALKVFSGEKLATVYFWRAVGWNKKGNYAQRVALVIGNGAYVNVKALPNPPNDACSIAKSLRDIGFTVSEGVDLDRAAMQKMTRDFLRDAARAQVALVYYAGHGVQIEGRNYLVPVDVQLRAGANITDGMIGMDTILAGLDDQVRTNILIFDACRNNPMAQQVASAGPNRAIEAGSGLAAPAALSAGATLGAGTLIAFVTAPGQVALDGEGANSPFSAELSRHIGMSGLEVQQMLTRVRAEVVAATKSKQVPWSNSSLLGEVYLAAK